jgi:lactoylglutathione lyase
LEQSWEFTTADGKAQNVHVADEAGGKFQLSETEGKEPTADGGRYDHVAVGVENVDATFEAIDHHGVVKEPADQPEDGARTAFVNDPDGHAVELIEPL